jgi:hypothetical protein
VLPEPETITEIGSSALSYSGLTDTPCSAIYEG